MEIVRYIKEILIERGKVIVPNLGTFEKVIIPASIDKATGDMQPPKPNIVFYDNTDVGNIILCDYISEKLNIKSSEVSKQLKEKVESWNADLNANKKVAVEGLGYLYKNKEGKTAFHSEITAESFPEFYGLSAINVKTKDKILAGNKTVKTTTSKVSKPSKKETKPPKKETKPPQKTKPVVKKSETKVKTKSEKKKNKRKLVWALLLIPLLALIGLIIWKFDYVKEQSAQVVDYFITEDTNNSSNEVKVINSADSASVDSKKDSLEKVAKKEKAETENILKNYTIIDSKTNNQINPKVEEFKAANKIHIIAGSFSNKSFARQERRRLMKKGFKNAKVLPLTNNKYRVSIESFNEVKDAVKDISRIKSIDSSLDVWLLIDK